MKIYLAVDRVADQINWRHQIMRFQDRIDFNLHSSIRPHEELGVHELRTFDIVVLVINELQGFRQLSDLIKEKDKMTHWVCLFTKDCEALAGRMAIVNAVEKEMSGFDSWIFESELTEQLLYHSLFKPSKRRVKSLEKGTTEMIVIQDEMVEEQVERLQKIDTGDELKKRLWGMGFGRRDKKGYSFLGEGCTLPRMKICIHGHSAFAYELGAVLATATQQRVILLDLDRLSPSADIYCGVKPILNEKYHFFSKTAATGLNVILDCMKKQTLQREAFDLCTQKIKGFDKLHILTGVYQLEDYEYYKAEDLKALIDSAASFYDVIILKVNSYPYDGFTMKSFLIADWIINAMSPEIEEIRTNRRLINLLKEKQSIPLERHLWVLFEMGQIHSVEKQFLFEMAAGKQGGTISFNEKRERCLRTGESYLGNQIQKLQRDYEPIIGEIYKGR